MRDWCGSVCCIQVGRGGGLGEMGRSGLTIIFVDRAKVDGD
jgi:hypothetical protein